MTGFLGSIDLSGSWTTAWNAISGPLGNFSTLMSAVGAILVVAGILGYIWERRRNGGGGNHQKLIYTIIIGSALSAPGIVIPVILIIVDWIANGIVGLLSHTTGSGGGTSTGIAKLFNHTSGTDGLS